MAGQGGGYSSTQKYSDELNLNISTGITSTPFFAAGTGSPVSSSMLLILGLTLAALVAVVVLHKV